MRPISTPDGRCPALPSHHSLRPLARAVRGLDGLTPGQTVEVEAEADDGKKTVFKTRSRVDNETEVGYMHNGGILPLVLRELITKS